MICPWVTSRAGSLARSARGKAEIRDESRPGGAVRLKDSCITQLEAQGLSGTCNKSQEEDNRVLAGLSGGEAALAVYS